MADLIKLREYRPTFVELNEPPHTAEVASTAEALALPWVKKWMEPGNMFALDGNHLMVHNADNTWWWVVAIVSGSLDLPQWPRIRFRCTS